MSVETAESPLDYKRLVQQTPIFQKVSLPAGSCRSKFSRCMEAISMITGDRYDINCKSHRCEKHKSKWAKKWSCIIGEQLEKTPCTLLVNLTTAEFVGNKEIELALQVFIRKFRGHYGLTEYVKVVEMNKRHTQPHFHLLFVCDDLKIPAMPPNWNKTLSWPPKVFDMVKYFWSEALAYAAPRARKTSVVWLQPARSGAAAATYAVNYITGGKPNKNEDLDEQWRGRKITFSKGFFYKRAAEIYADLLEKWFGPAQMNRFYWLASDSKTIENSLPTDDVTQFLKMPIVRQRQFEANWLHQTGEMIWQRPPAAATADPDLNLEISDDGQEYFTIEPPG